MSEQKTRANHEILVSDDAPTTSQLFRLAAQAMGPARTTDTMRAMKKRPHTHFSIQEVQYYNEASDMLYDDYPAQIRRLMAIRVGRRTMDSVSLKEWTLKFFDTHWYERPGGVWAGVRNQYRFEWMHRGVTMAEHKAVIVPSTIDADMHSDLERLAISDDMADMMNMEMELSQVTAGDCDQLIADVADYHKQAHLFLRGRAA